VLLLAFAAAFTVGELTNADTNTATLARAIPAAPQAGPGISIVRLPSFEQIPTLRVSPPRAPAIHATVTPAATAPAVPAHSASRATSAAQPATLAPATGSDAGQHEATPNNVTQPSASDHSTPVTPSVPSHTAPKAAAPSGSGIGSGGG
jgi:hypothetical protein